MNRRHFIQICAGALSGACGLSASAHTPYRQWVVYRKKHLMIGCHRENLQTWELAKKIQTLLAQELPDARSRIARARTSGRLASLMGTDQLDSAVLEIPVAKSIMLATDGFEPYGPVDIRTIALLGNYTYVVKKNLPDDHVSLLASALSHIADSDVKTVSPEVPWHDALTG
jgi:hypothetical protein